MVYGIVFCFGALTALGLNTSLTKKTAIFEGVATQSARSNLQEETARVAWVIDGDTIELDDGRRVRYIGVDAAEMGDGRRSAACFAREAMEENGRLVEGKTVRLARDVSETDRYGRILRYVFVDDVFINEALVRQGFANVATFPPDVAHREQFLESQREAREQGRGLWASCY